MPVAMHFAAATQVAAAKCIATGIGSSPYPPAPAGAGRVKRGDRPIITDATAAGTALAAARRLLYNDTGLPFPVTKYQEETMLRATALLLAIGVAGAAFGKDDKVKEEKPDGTWVATSYVEHGKKNSDVIDAKFTLVLKDGKYTVKINGEVADQGTFTFDASKSPKHIDTTSSEGDNKGKVDRGIYELKGDVLKTAFDDITVQKRPTAFDGEKYQVVEFKRAKE
jgi:uncharacterized protein (TIGR03067 family)